MVRSNCCDKTKLKKGTWTPEEDRKLIDYITRYGCWNWRQLPKFAGLSRCGKSCRLRWMNYLRPNIKRGNFSKEEEDKIINLHVSLGNRWSAIAAQLPGRTDNEIKNYWHTNVKKRSRQVSTSQGDKPSSSYRPKRKTSREKISQVANNSSLNTSFLTHHQIFESSQIPSSPSSNIELCSFKRDDTSSVNCTSFVAESDVSSSEMSAETSGSFWTEPFLADNDDSTAFNAIVDTGFLSPYYPIIGDEFLCSYDFYDENDNLLNW